MLSIIKIVRAKIAGQPKLMLGLAIAALLYQFAAVPVAAGYGVMLPAIDAATLDLIIGSVQ